MRSGLRLAVLLALATVGPAGPLRAQPGPAPGFSAVTALLQDSLPDLGGGEFLLMQHGRVVYRASFGAWDSTAAVPIASASKWLLGTLVMSLVADGTLSLDDTVGRWLPTAPADKRPITLRQLVTHTSGLPSLDVGSCLDDRTTTLAACAQSVLSGPMRSPPGEAFRYGGLSMQVAGRIAEVAAGRPFNDLFAERVAAPLGLARTDFGPGGNPRVAGGASSTAAEYARVLQMLLDGGGPVLTPATVDAMLADQTRGARIVYSPYQDIAALVGDPSLAEARYGVGVWQEEEWASQGAFGFSPWIDRTRGVVGVLAVQNQLKSVYPTYVRLKALVRAALDETATGEGRAPVTSGGVLRLGPNPARESVWVETAGPGTLRLFDVLGREVRRLDVAAPGRIPIPLDGVRAGAYSVRLDDGGGAAVARFVVAR